MTLVGTQGPPPSRWPLFLSAEMVASSHEWVSVPAAQP